MLLAPVTRRQYTAKNNGIYLYYNAIYRSLHGPESSAIPTVTLTVQDCPEMTQFVPNQTRVSTEEMPYPIPYGHDR